MAPPRFDSRAGLPGASSSPEGKRGRHSLETLPVLEDIQVSARPGDLISASERAATNWVAHTPKERRPATTGDDEETTPEPWGQPVAPSRLQGNEGGRPLSASPEDYRERVGYSTPVDVGRKRAVGRSSAARGDDAVQELAAGDVDIATASELQLCDDDLAESAVASLAACIAGNRALVSLDLSGAERATQHTMAVLCGALEGHPTVSHLDIHGMPLHPRNLGALLAANAVITTLDLYGCYDAREALSDGCWVALRYDLLEHGDPVASKGEVLAAHVDSEGVWRVRGAAVPAAQLRRACYSEIGATALLADGLKDNKALLHLNLALPGGAAAATLAPALLAHPTLLSFNSLPLRTPAGAGDAFALTVAHLAGRTEVALLADRWLAPPLGEAPLALTNGGYNFASLAELRLSGAAGGLDAGAMQALFQALTRQGRRRQQVEGASEGEPAGVGQGGCALPLQTLVVTSASVPAEAVASVLRSHDGLRTLELSGVTDSAFAPGVAHAADLSAVLRSLAVPREAGAGDHSTSGLWLQELGVPTNLQRLRYVRRVSSARDYASQPGLDGKRPPHPQRRPPRRVWLAETAQHSRRPSPAVIELAAEEAGPLSAMGNGERERDRSAVAVVRVEPDPDEGLGVVLEDEAETNNAFVVELLDTSTGRPGAAERAGMALGAVVLTVDDHSVTGLGCVAVAAKVRVARAAGRAVVFTLGGGGHRVSVRGGKRKDDDEDYVALTQSVRDGAAGVKRQAARKFSALAVEDLAPAGYSGARALGVLGAALRENRSLTTLSLTVNPAVVAPRHSVLLDAEGRQLKPPPRANRRSGQAHDYGSNKRGENRLADAGASEELALASGEQHKEIRGGDGDASLPQWALSWSDVSRWAEAVEEAAVLQSYNGLDLTGLRTDSLVELDLRRRLIGGDGALLLARFLRDLKKLQRLVLQDCALPAVGTAALLETLRPARHEERQGKAKCKEREEMLQARLESLHEAALAREELARQNRGGRNTFPPYPASALQPPPVLATGDGALTEDWRLSEGYEKRKQAAEARIVSPTPEPEAQRAAELAQQAAAEAEAENWDRSLHLLAEAGALDPQSEEIAEEDAVVTRMAMLAMEPSRPNHIGGLGQYNRTLKEMDLRGCTVDANQLHRLLSWRTAHAERHDHRAAPVVHVMYEDRWLLGPVVAAETVAARSLEATIKASAAVQIQAWARRLLARLLRARLQRERDCNAAALRLQCWWRGLLSLRELEGRIDDRSRRAVALAGQALWRGKMGRAEAANLREKRLAELRAAATAASLDALDAVFEAAWQRVTHRELWNLSGNEETAEPPEEEAEEMSEAARLMKDAVGMADTGDWHGALALYDCAASELLQSGGADPDTAFGLHFGRAECHLGLEAWSDAAASFAAALAERPGDGAALHGRGCARWGEGRAPLAWADFSRALLSGYALAAGPCAALEAEVEQEERDIALEMSHADDSNAARALAEQREAAVEAVQREDAARTVQAGVRRRLARNLAAQERVAEEERRELGQLLTTLTAQQAQEQGDGDPQLPMWGVPLPRQLWSGGGAQQQSEAASPPRTPTASPRVWRP